MPPIIKSSRIDEFARVAKSPIHGDGLFAKKFIPKGEFLGSYEGYPYSGDLEIEDTTYVLWMDGHKRRGIIGQNNLCYANSSPDPNIVARLENRKPNFYAIKDINAGQELTYDYLIDHTI